MYNSDQLRKVIDSPNLALREANRLYHSRLNSRPYNPDGVEIMSADWDNLLILDACRYDMYQEEVGDNADLSRVQSRGSGTVEFLYANFSDQDFHDTVYVTANPQYYYHREELHSEFHAVIDVWRDEGWDEEYGTVLPETMVQRALEAAERFRNKRLIVHFLQPHYPFLSDRTEFDKGHMETGKGEKGDFWRRIFIGDIEPRKDVIWQEYSENLRAVLPPVRRLAGELTGRTVITSDHGNMVGERASPIPITEWGHPLQLYTKQLVDVPWHVVPSETRKKVVAEPPENRQESLSDDVVADRLADLGYV